jgi:hypothetical protein
VHVVAADVQGHRGQGAAAGGHREPERLLDALGQALDVERVARTASRSSAAAPAARRIAYLMGNQVIAERMYRRNPAVMLHAQPGHRDVRR